MTIAVTFPSAGGQSGSGYTVPEPADTFNQSLTDYLVAIASKGLTTPTSADLDLGSAFGAKALYFKTRTANPASAGILRLAAADSFGFRNQANGADVLFTIDSGNALLFAGANVTGNPMLGANTAAGQSIPNATTTIVVFGTVERDSDSAYNSGTGRYTVPTGKGGDYEITAVATWNAAATTPSIEIDKNAALLKRVAYGTTGAGDISMVIFVGSVTLVAGDIIDIRVFQNSGGAVVLKSQAASNYFSIKRIPT